MVDKLVDALRAESLQWREEWKNAKYSTKGMMAFMIFAAFVGLAARLAEHSDNPQQEPGGEESTPDKPF